MNEQRIIDVTLPLSPQHQIEYFKDKSILFRVDIKNSRISPKQCLMTLSNMRLKAEVQGVTPELLKEYMTGNFVVETTNLAKITANVIFGYKYQEMPYTDVQNDFSLEDYAHFIVDNQEMIEQWCNLIKSIPLYLAMSATKFLDEETLELLRQELPKVEGRLPAIGANLSQVLALPEFLVMFNTDDDLKNLMSQSYYPYYFDEQVYGGEKLISFLASENHKTDFAVLSTVAMQFLKEKELK